MTIGELRIDFDQSKVYLAGKRLNLTHIQYKLLCLLAINKDTVMTYEELLTSVWGEEYKNERAYLWINISRMRLKMENTPEKTRYIYTHLDKQISVGYVLRTPKGSQ